MIFFEYVHFPKLHFFTIWKVKSAAKVHPFFRDTQIFCEIFSTERTFLLL